MPRTHHDVPIDISLASGPVGEAMCAATVCRLTGFRAFAAPARKAKYKEHHTLNTNLSAPDVAESSSLSTHGPVRAGRGLYKSIAIVTLVMMLFGSLAIAPMAAAAAPASNAAISNGVTVERIGEPVYAQSGASLVGLLIAVLMDIRAGALSGNNASAPPANTEGGIVGIIYAAADAYGQPRADMLRVAKCESNLVPTALNPSSQASGLFQFLPSTWATTPFADQDIFDPVASANAAAWMWDNGRRNEWVCQ